MYSQIIQAVLRLLPGNLNQSPDNPIQIDRLGDISGAELDFPVYQDPPAVARRRLGILVFLASLVAPVLAWFGDLLPFYMLTGGLNTIALLIATALVVYGLVAKWWPLAAVALAIISLPIVAMLVRDIPFALGTLIVVAVAQIVFADSLATSFLYFKTAAPLPRPQSNTARSLWKKRFYNFRQPIRGSEVYLLGGLVMLPAGWLVLSHLSKHGSNSSFEQTTKLFSLLVVLGSAWFLASENLLTLLYGRKPYSLLAASRAMIRALTAWSNYNRLASPGAGVHQSPAGPCGIRRSLLVGTIIGWACLWAGFQLSPVRSPMEVIFDQADHAMREQRQSKTPDIDFEAAKPAPLTADEEEFLRLLPPDQQSEYMRKRLLQPLVADTLEQARTTRNGKSPQSLVLDSLSKAGTIVLRALVPSVGTLLAAFALLLPMAGRALAGIEECFGRDEPKRQFTTLNWERLVTRLRHSNDKTEQDSVLMGVNSRDDTPVMVPRIVFQEHAHMLGDTGSGKTSQGLAPLLTQLMRFNDCSIVVLDLKADNQSLFEALREESKALTDESRAKDPNHAGYPFRWFTTVLGRSSFAFNPLAQSMMPKLSPDQRTDIITAALGLQYGSDYGRKYFGDANYDVLNYALRRFPNVESLAELEEILLGAQKFDLPEDTKKAGSHVRSSVRRLARIRALNACRTKGTPQSVLDNAIDLDQVFTRPQSLYVALPPASGISNTAEIARIFLYSLLAAAQTHVGKRTQVYLVIDEFQRIVSKNVELFLQQARSMNIGCILSNQSLADLDSVGADLIPAVRTNTRFRQVFGAGHQADIEDIVYSSGEATYGMRSWSFASGVFRPYLQGFNIAETRNTRLSLNDVLLATDAAGRNIACVRRGAGYAQFGGMPFIMDSVHHISSEKYDDRCKQEWPAVDERTLVATLADTFDTPDTRKAVILESTPSVPQNSILETPELDQGDDSNVEETDSLISEQSSEGVEFSDLDRMHEMSEEAHRERLRKMDEKKNKRKRRPL